MRLKRILAVGTMALAAVAFIALPAASAPNGTGRAIPHYQHIVEIMMENTSYATIIGNSNAPRSTPWPATTASPRTTSGSRTPANRTT